MGHPIEASGLVRRFGDLTAVDGVDLEVAEGEIFGFLGPNGAGKSTTVRMLTTLLAPSAGSARVAGYDVVKEAGMVRRSIGVALQDAAIDPLMSGRELLQLQSILHGIPRKEADKRSGRAPRAGRADRGGRPSGRHATRAACAAASTWRCRWSTSPRVLFLDEPTTGLDPMSRIALWEEVRRLNEEQGMTVLAHHPVPGGGRPAGRAHRHHRPRPDRASRAAPTS